MIKKLILLLIVVAAAASCSSPARQTSSFPTATFEPPSNSAVIQPIQSPSFSPTPLETTLVPVSTPTVDPVFLSTFDPKTALTRTPSRPQKCPQANPGLKPQFSPESDREMVPYTEYFPKALDFLNAGGRPELVRNILVGTDPHFWAEEDLTGDGIPEVIMSTSGTDILMCVDGKYVDMLHIYNTDPFPPPDILAIQDMNLDGVPELVVRGSVMSAGVLIFYIYEWDGTNFKSLIWSAEKLAAWYNTPIGRAMRWYTYWKDNSLYSDESIDRFLASGTIQDTDGDGTLELLIQSDIPPHKYIFEGPWRKTTEEFRWNGFYFSQSRLDLDPPAYRFQAVEDADRYSLLREDQKALALYEQVITSRSLSAWSLDNYHAQLSAETSGHPIPTLIPIIQEESDQLAAYSLYRIMLLRLLQNEPAEAQTVYEELQRSYPQGRSGHLYAELAASFWEKYNASQNMGEACSAAIRFAEVHEPEIYTYLGNAYDYANSHGGQSHFYTAWDLCPFK